MRSCAEGSVQRFARMREAERTSPLILVGDRANSLEPEPVDDRTFLLGTRLFYGAFGGSGPSSRFLRDKLGLSWRWALNLRPGYPGEPRLAVEDRKRELERVKELTTYLVGFAEKNGCSLVLCGARVSKDFGVPFEPFVTFLDRVRLHVIPHPSPRNRMWNQHLDTARLFTSTLV